MEPTNLREGMLLGMGNPLLDITAVVEEDFLEKYSMKPNDAILATEKHRKSLYSELMEKFNVEYTAGGSVQNALRVAQWVIEKPRVATFFGCVGEDTYSKILEEKARSNGVNVQYQYVTNENTGTCAVLITGQNRSLCANLAAANCFTIDHIRKPANKKFIEDALFYYVSGFFLTVSPESILEVADFALKHKRPFLMNLSAPFICQYYKDKLMRTLPYVDVIFGNETEAETFANEQNFGTHDLREIAVKICELPKFNVNQPRICVITTGDSPVIVAVNGVVREYPVVELTEEQLIDTNGAGDAFVGGFLAQYIQNQALDVCIKCGIWTATEIIQRSGCTYEGIATFRP